MHAKSYLKGVLLVGISISVLFLFNNCDGMSAQKYSTTTSDSTDGDGAGGGTGGGTLTQGQQYFTNTLVPTMQNLCSNCHTAGKASVRIFDYAFASSFALVGPSASNNPLYNKVRDILAHGIASAVLLGDPTDLCPLDNRGTVSPCREIRNWILLERPQFNDSVMLGQINYISLLGEVSGYAIQSSSPTAAINVAVYANAPFNQGGTFIGNFLADKSALNTVENGHTFKFTLPAAYADGTQRRIFVYGVSATVENVLFNSPFSYVAFPGSGRTFFENNVRPRLTCNNCHFWTYEEAFSKLALPLFSAGATATNNTLINKMRGLNHSGGNQCPGGLNAEPCASVQNWWNSEF